MIKILIVFILIIQPQNSSAIDLPTSKRAEKAIAAVEPALKKELFAKGFEYGVPIFIRIFKEPGVLEVWIKSTDGKFKNFKNYNICRFSGNLGPKLKQGDQQSPEGFYYVTAKQLNPWSQFHLSFNLGYPNKYDKFHDRTGSALMVHGGCVSIGCYAMTDDFMNEIYSLMVMALKSHQAFIRVHIFPFKLENKNLSKYSTNQWYSFWLNMKEGYDYFNKFKQPPNVEVINGQYVFGH